jgi:HK97 family phage major capsid protein
VRRDKLFFFFSYEGSTRHATSLGTEWVETPEQKSNREAVEAAKRNGAEMKEVATLAEMHALESVLIAGTKAGKGASDIRADMVAAMRERMAKGVPSVNNPIVELTPKEQKQYNYSRGIEAMLNGKDSFETDVSQEIIRQTGVTARSEFSFFVPTSTRAGLYNAATVGAEVVFDAPGSFIDMLRNKARVLQLGATYLGGIREPLTFPEQTTAGTATWVAENSGSDVSDSNAVFTTKTLTPKTLMSSTSFSRQLLRQAHTNFDIDNIVRSDLAAIHGLAIDLACLTGGASNSPQGIFSNTNVSVYLIATNGAAPSYTDMVAHEYTVELNNGNVSSMGFLTTPAIKGTLKTTQKFASTNGEPVWQGGEVGEVAGYKAFSSNQVNKNITAGTSTTLAHAIYFGCWDQLYIGEWGAMETIVDPYRLKKQGMIEVTTFQMIGLMVRRPKAFVYSKSALAAAAFA